MDRRRILYLPVETKARELLGKSFLAARAVERGWYVILGSGPEVRAYMEDHPPGVFVVASVPVAKAPRLEKMRIAGHHVCNLCEESIVYLGAEEYCDRKLSPEALTWVSRLLVVGQCNAEHVRTNRPEHAQKIAITGNPRFDTLLPDLRGYYEKEAKGLRRRYGRFILVNTNFSFANPFDPGEDVVTRFMRGAPDPSGTRRAYYKRLVDYKARQMKGLQSVVEKLAAANVVERIIIRPHPVENHETWRQWAKNVARVEVRYESTANAWMLAAEAVLHAGCTTGIEGLLLDRPVFSYVPNQEPNEEFLNQSDLVSQQFASAGELFGSLRGPHQNVEPCRRTKDGLAQLIANVSLPFAADRILDQLEQLDLPEVSRDHAGIPNENRLGKADREPNQCRGGNTHATSVTRRQEQKFPRLTREDICTPLSEWRGTGVLNAVPRLARFTQRLWAMH